MGLAAAAIGVPAIVQGIGSIGGAILGSSASKKAAQDQANANKAVIDSTNQAVTGGKNDIATGTTNANDILSRSAQTQLGMFQPYTAAGQDAVANIQKLSGDGGPLAQQFSFNPADLANDPGYAFALKQGMAAINRSQAAKGGLFSGTTDKALNSFATGTASTYFDNAYKRAADTFNINRTSALDRISTMQGLAGMGLSATNAGAGAVGSTSAQQAGNAETQGLKFADLGMQGNQTIASALTRTGDSKAAGDIGSTNSILSGIGGFGSAVSNAALSSFLLKRGVGGSSPSGGGQQPAGAGWNGTIPASWGTGINDDA